MYIRVVKCNIDTYLYACMYVCTYVEYIDGMGTCMAAMDAATARSGCRRKESSPMYISDAAVPVARIPPRKP